MGVFYWTRGEIGRRVRVGEIGCDRPLVTRQPEDEVVSIMQVRILPSPLGCGWIILGFLAESLNLSTTTIFSPVAGDWAKVNRLAVRGSCLSGTDQENRGNLVADKRSGEDVIRPFYNSLSNGG